MNPLICILARDGSTRFPGKHLELVREKSPVTLLGNIIERCFVVDIEVVAAVPETSETLINYLDGLYYLFTGCEDDVLLRMLQAADAWTADTVVRVGGDAAMVCPELMRALIVAHEASGADFTYPVNVPRGTFSQVIDVEALQNLHDSLTPAERVSDDVTGMLMRIARKCAIDYQIDGWEDMRFTVDYPADLEVIREVYRDLGGYPFIPELVEWWRERY